jgi:TPR repeat protein
VEWSGVEWSGVQWSGVQWSGVDSSTTLYHTVSLYHCITVSHCITLCHTVSHCITVSLGVELNDPQAQYNLGFLALKGRGIARSRQQAAHYFELAAAQGHAAAQQALRSM